MFAVSSRSRELVDDKNTTSADRDVDQQRRFASLGADVL
jgi:hypothetical protein